MSGDAGTPPSKRAFLVYVGAVVGLGATLVALTYLTFAQGLVDFVEVFLRAPVEAVRTYPVISLFLCLSFAGLTALVAVILLFGARVNRIQPEDTE